MANGKYTAEQMIGAIELAEGNLTEAARKLGCSRTTLYNYMDKYVTVKDAYEEANERTIDWVQDKLLDQCRRGNITAIIFYLKTKAKHRGYVERQEVTGADNQPLTIRYVNDWRDNSALSASRADSGNK